jgi:hypothetical protein
MDDMEHTLYGFRNCVGAFFEMPTSDARRLLPSHLQPLEVQHTRSVLAITGFEFTESSVGEYDEVVLAVIVPPLVVPGEPLPRAAFFPFMVATSTEASRLHAIERWHLPHHMRDVEMNFTPSEGEIELTVKDAGAPILDLVVTEYGFEPVNYLYNAFTVDGGNRFKANIHMEAQHSEHEEERGSLTLYEHAMTAGLTLDDVSTIPFREQWYQQGLQTFEPLQAI